MFLVLLLLTALTGILINFTRLMDKPFPTYAIYVIHMMVAVPMLVLEVPLPNGPTSPTGRSSSCC